MKINNDQNKNLIIKTLRQLTLIVLLAAIPALAVNQIRPNRLPLVEDWSPEVRLTTDSGESLVISLEEAEAMCLAKMAVFLDARSPEDYARGHIRCAKNLPWQSFEDYIDRVIDIIPDDTMIVTYCDGETCSLSEDLARELVSMGYGWGRVRVLLNGWTRWVEAGLPVESGLGKIGGSDLGSNRKS